MEETHIMENVIYNELRYRGFNVDLGQVDVNERTDRIDVNGHPIYAKKPLEVDFVATLGSRRFYIQSALILTDEKKAESEKRSLKCIEDSFTKVVVTRNGIHPYRDEDGIAVIDLFDFLMEEDSLEKV